MVDTPRIVIFEDQDVNFKLLRDALEAEVGQDFEVIRYEGARELKGPRRNNSRMKGIDRIVGT